ncbi:Cna B-type domain-containing protein [Aerococcaceae bacterium NML191219]|nr:Cna B-type domain-containing protein [Aerococcaceae bacterium NML191219]
MLLVNTVLLPLNVSAQEVNNDSASTEVVETLEVPNGLPSEEIGEAPSDSTDGELEEISSEETEDKEEEEIHLSVNNPAKELTNVLSDVIVWDLDNGREASMSEGKYQLTENNRYSFQMGFDLTAYDANLNNGDHFTVNIPTPVNIQNATIDLVDKDTGLTIGVATVTSAGENAGGSVRIVLQNLEKYLEVKQSTEVIGVKGTFYVNFTSLRQDTEKTLTFNNMKDIGTKDIIIKVSPRGTSDNTDAVGKENMAKYGGVLSKKPYNSPTLGLQGEYVHPWRIRLNAKKKQYTSFVITDRISETGGPMQFIPESFILRTGSGVNQGWQLDNPVDLVQGVDYTVNFDSSYTTFTLTINNLKAQPYFLDYQTTAPADGSTVGNIVSVETNEGSLPLSDTNTQTELLVERLSKITEGGTIQLDTGYRIVVYKVDEETRAKLPGAVFKVTKPDGSEFNLPPTGADGRTYSGVIPAEEAKKGQFTITEITAPEGYELDSTPIKVTVTKEGAIRTIINRKPKVNFTVTKKWINGDATNRPAVQFQLKRDGANYGEAKTLAANSQDGATVEWTNLPKYQDGTLTPSVYTVEELAVVDYTAVVSDVTATSATITNTYSNNEKVSISGKKVWNDYNNQFKTRPAKITVTVLQDGKEFNKTVDITGGTDTNEWMFEVTDLPKYSPAGKAYTYTLKEVTVAGYTVEYGESNTITNTYRNTETIDISGKKTWDDANNQDNKRPDNITVQVMNGNQKVAEKTVSQADNWAYTFTGLPKYDTNGELIPYTVTEVPVAEYQAMVEGYNITNSYTPAKTQVSVTKVWEDADNQDGKRPAQISVQLLANGVAQGQPITLNASNNWMHTWNDLALNQAGQPIAYTLQEVNVPAGYTSNIAETAAKQFTITNTYTPEKIGITGKKTWDDANNQDGKRPDNITVNLLAEGKIVQTVTADQASNWTYNFTDLPKYKAGQLIEYTVQEVVPAGYSATYNGYSITNSYTPAKTQVSVTKVWEDANNQDGIRPNDIQVQLYANGTAQGQPITLNAGNNWMHTWNDLDLKQQGQDIVYTVKEVGEVTGYTTAITEPAAKQFTLTNSHTPEVIEVFGKKTWEDANNQDGKRPSNITVHLIADGTTIDTKVVTEADNWTYSFTNLPKYKAGKAIQYTIDEAVVAGYQKVIDTYNLTNRYTPEQTDLTVVKAWDDADNQDGIRPEKITVALVADGKEVEQKDLTAANKWTHQWTNLPKYNNGVEIKYEVKEISKHDGYTTKVTHDATTRTTRITNSHTPEVTEVSGKKTWDDADNQDGKRPTTIEVALLADNTQVDTKVVTETANWSYNFTNLPKYKAGKMITYTVKEINVPEDYTAIVEGTNITNRYTPETTSFTVVKRWEDGNDADKIRPQSIKVQLYVAGKAEGSPVELSAANKWSHTFTDLPKFASGKELTYEVKEVDVPKGYNVTYKADSTTQTTITNSHTPTPKKEKDTLPKTGEDFPFGTTLIGALILAGVAGYVIYTKKRQK